MKNEEKADELSNEFENATLFGSPLSVSSAVYQAALKMAEWKDEQLKLTPDDIGIIFGLVLKERVKWTDQKGCYEDVIRLFYEQKNS